VLSVGRGGRGRGGWALAGASWLLALACSETADPPRTLTIGAVIDQVSASAFASWPSAAHLAIAHVNQGLTMAGSTLQVQLLLNDTSQDAAVTTTRALDMVRNQGARAVITDTSKNGIAVTKLNYDADPGNDLGVPIVCVTCTAPNLNDPMAKGTDDIDTATLQDAQNWAFRTCNRATEQTGVLKRVILSRGNNGDANGDGKFKLSIAVLDDNSGHGFVKSTQALFAAVDPNVIVEKIVLPGPAIDINNATFWDGIAEKLIDDANDCPQDPANTNACLPATAGGGEPDALMENLNPGYNVALSQALTRRKSKVTFFHAHAFRSAQTAAVLGAAIDGQEGVSSVLFDDSPSGTAFAAALQAARGSGPAVLDGSVYDATVVLSLALLKAGKGLADPLQVTGAQVRDALQQLNDPAGAIVRVGPAEMAKAYQAIVAGAPINYEGAAGPVDFDAYGNVWVKLALYAGKNGAFVDVQKFDCVHDSTCPAVP
jgi:hypothetical protein